MTIFQIDQELPNGFHDALIHRITLDYQSDEVNIDISIWTGSMDSAEDSEREQYSRGTLVLLQMKYFSIEQPGNRAAHDKLCNLRIDLCDDPERPNLPFPDQSGNFYGSFYVVRWNSFIHFSAKDARLDFFQTESSIHKQ